MNFFNGLMLTAADLAVEQEYHRTARYLHNRLHGYGAVSGLEVTVANEQVEVSPGMGIDVRGREIVLTEAGSLQLEPQQDTGLWVRDLVIEWHETPECPVPGSDGADDFTRWVEQPELALRGEGEAAAEELVLARLTWTVGGEVDVDTSVRRPFGPA
ncbi:MAG: hypothetical protein ABI890_02270 [Lapillicoccus sp.]